MSKPTKQTPSSYSSKLFCNVCDEKYMGEPACFNMQCVCDDPERMFDAMNAEGIEEEIAAEEAEERRNEGEYNMGDAFGKAVL